MDLEALCGRSIRDAAGLSWCEEWVQSDIDTLRAAVQTRRFYRAMGLDELVTTDLETWTERQLCMAHQMEDDPLDIPEYPEFLGLDEPQTPAFEIVHDSQVLRIPEWDQTDIEALREIVGMRRACRLACPLAVGIVKTITALTERQRIYAEQHADDEPDPEHTITSGQEAGIQ